MGNRTMITTWAYAAEQLKLKIASPFKIITKDNQWIEFLLLVEDFGSVKGTLIGDINHSAQNSKIATEFGYYFSALNPENYSLYNENLFIDTLNDWGYFGAPENKPSWYTGKPWS